MMSKPDLVACAPNMLIADDDPCIVRVLADRCRRLGFKVDTATNGIQALVKATRHAPDILVVDVNMPEIDGLSVCARLLDPGRKPLNVVVVTGSRNPENLERCEGFGAFYTRKGVNFWSELEAVLTEIYPGLAENINRSDKCSSAVLETRIRPRVLLVDDDADVSRLLSTRLSKFGVDTLYAVNPVQGYRIACREEPSVIISDYFMPDGGAEYLLARLRTTPATQDIPVIVLSGRELSEVIQQNLRREICQHSGAALILRKSVDTTELLDVLRKYCGFEVNLDGTRRDARHVAEVCVGKGLS